MEAREGPARPGPRGLVIASPASGSGKTVVTLATLRALRDLGVRVGSAKVGPDYIDPQFHSFATGSPCVNLDPWAMGPGRLFELARRAGASANLVVAEGVMGLFDGAFGGGGSTADLAALFGWPVVLVIDVRGQGASVGALLRGFRDHRSDVAIAGVILNRVGSPNHERTLERACAPFGIPVLGALPRENVFSLPDRHLGLVQPEECHDWPPRQEAAAKILAAHVDLDALLALAKPLVSPEAPPPTELPVPPLGERIAVAADRAFRFAYTHVLEGWERQGARITRFSPLLDEPIPPGADGVYLPGGYPELHASRIAAASHFLETLREAAARGVPVLGECGGYMVLGSGLVDVQGRRHPMAGLLPLETSLARRRLQLGYREVRLVEGGALGDRGARFRGHEFHYATVIHEGDGDRLFETWDAEGHSRPAAGLRRGSVMGSFVHMVDSAAGGVGSRLAGQARTGGEGGGPTEPPPTEGASRARPPGSRPRGSPR